MLLHFYIMSLFLLFTHSLTHFVQVSEVSESLYCQRFMPRKKPISKEESNVDNDTPYIPTRYSSDNSEPYDLCSSETDSATDTPTSYLPKLLS